jgi:hypothetical protein
LPYERSGSRRIVLSKQKRWCSADGRSNSGRIAPDHKVVHRPRVAQSGWRPERTTAGARTAPQPAPMGSPRACKQVKRALACPPRLAVPLPSVKSQSRVTPCVFSSSHSLHIRPQPQYFVSRAARSEPMPLLAVRLGDLEANASRANEARGWLEIAGLIASGRHTSLGSLNNSRRTQELPGGTLT